MSRRIITSLFLLAFIPFYSISAQSKDALSTKELPLGIQYSETRIKPITHIVIHSISNIESKPDSPFNIVDIYFLLAEYGVSTHYVIGREGDIYQFVSDNRVAYHAGRNSLPNLPFFDHDMNEYSIGIELMGIGTKDELVPSISEEIYNNLDPSFIGFTEDQYNSLSLLLDTLHNRYPTIPKDRYHVIGHDDYAPKRKVDPGKLFNWRKLGYEK
ncbi:N-acetylmuramoyl-L-alanine amidase [Paucisalibacillus sp. EB02]|uniref:N-acetylmuramoyl-L-alanine amidase n=1 Tax=Paucisalibacillus sp. EB02 TaxID=1347087 RepID=UPI0004B5EDE2|nr:N-acetylmuramoyl-L-alanine amidase [Paucisalibacillus sp. EB02]